MSKCLTILLLRSVLVVKAYGMDNFNGETVRSLTAEEWDSFVNLVYRESFWSMPSEIKESLPNDGAAWMFEGANGGQYHLIFRVTPSDKLNEIFRSLFKLTGVKTEHELYLSQVPPNKSLDVRAWAATFIWRCPLNFSLCEFGFTPRQLDRQIF